MASILLGRMRSEFLATPTLVRFMVDDYGNPSLALKAPALQLKYLVAAEVVSLLLMSFDGDGFAYAVSIPDDPRDPAYAWSTIDTDDEVAALRALLHGKRGTLDLFNEIAVNVASTIVHFEGVALVERELADGQRLTKTTPPGIPKARVLDAIDAMHGGTQEQSGWRLTATLGERWSHPTTWYYSNGNTASFLSLVDSDDGSQQESLCLWLTDAFAPQGAYLNPQVTAGPAARTRELCDVLLTSAGHTVLVESKALAVLTRRRLPTRDELHGDVVKHIQKAAKQVSGAARYLRMGHRVTDQRGQNVAVDRDKPLHLIVLIPDLTMLSAADNLGREFLAEQILKHECYFHVLDPTQLLRLVQAATTVARCRPRISEIDALNWCLVKRLERALDHDSPAFDMIFRFDDDPNANPAASDESSS